MTKIRVSQILALSILCLPFNYAFAQSCARVWDDNYSGDSMVVGGGWTDLKGPKWKEYHWAGSLRGWQKRMESVSGQVSSVEILPVSCDVTVILKNGNDVEYIKQNTTLAGTRFNNALSTIGCFCESPNESDANPSAPPVLPPPPPPM